MPLSYTCCTCLIEQPPENFYPAKNKRGLKYDCKICSVLSSQEWKGINRKRIFDHYGPCSCCGENRLIFLTIDHINNDGAEHRSLNKLASGDQTYCWIVRNNYPTNLQSMCFSCNTAKAHSQDKICHCKDNNLVRVG